MHRLLEWGDASDSHALAAAREFRLSPAQGQHAAAMATRILQGEGAWAWDPAALSWQGNEVELMIAGESRRLDRLVQRRDGEPLLVTGGCWTTNPPTPRKNSPNWWPSCASTKAPCKPFTPARWSTPRF
jgi:hypothetical protein